MSSTEAREIQFANPIESVAQAILGPEFDWSKLYNYPTIKRHLPILKNIIVNTRSDYNPLSYPYTVISKLTDQTSEDLWFDREGVSWTIAAAIIHEPDIFSDFSELELRFLLDASLGVSITDMQRRQAIPQLRAPYEKSPERHKELLEAAEHWKRRVNMYEKFQKKLRESVSESAGIERK